MKLIVLILVGLFINSHQVQSQNKITSGGFGHFTSGLVLANNTKVESYLNGPNVLGPINLQSLGTLSGGQGYGILGEKLVIGGGGFGIVFPRVSNDKAILRSSAGSGKFNIGYIFLNKNLTLAYVYGGLGAAGFSYLITNKSQEPIFFDKYRPIYEGESETYSLSGTSYEFGVGYKKFLFSYESREACKKEGELSKVSGLMLGVDIGFNYTVATNGWSNLGVGPEFFNPFFGYLRLTIGGGGANVSNCIP